MNVSGRRRKKQPPKTTSKINNTVNYLIPKNIIKIYNISA
jgi:hypothetical protein